MRDIKEIIIHHSATKDSGTVSWQAIRRYHIETKGWSDIGYHFGVELVNDRYEVLVGRPLRKAGAHTVGHNEHSVGVCFIGDFDNESPCNNQFDEGAKLVVSLLDLFGLKADAIHGHSEFAAKSCPGELFLLEQFKRLCTLMLV